MPDYKPLPVLFRKSPEVQATIDFFDTITGIGYKKFYFTGTKDTTSSKFILTTDSTVHSDDENTQITGPNEDEDFDIEIGVGFTISAEDAICTASLFADGVILASFIIKHVTSGGTETTIGTVVHNSLSGSGSDKFFLKTAHIKLTEKRFSKGEKLRFTYISSAGTAANSKFHFDPSGISAQTTELPNYPHTSFILIPIRVDEL